MRQHTSLRLFFLFFFAFVVVSCSTVSRTERSLQDLEKEAQHHNKEHEKTLNVAIDSLSKRALQNDGVLNILLLSGGGQNGAYGVGFLRGWKSRPENAMPQFDLVSGISTGALQASFALIGTPEALKQASELYVNAETDIIPSFDWSFWFRKTGGLLNTKNYQNAIHTIFNSQHQEQLNNAFKQDRRLFIGTTDFDLAVGKIWNIQNELQKNDGLERFHKILLAATAIPGIFPTQIIDDHIHSDGGITSNILPILSLSDYKKLALKIRQQGFTKPVKIHLWVVMNYWTHARIHQIDPASRGDMSKRSMFLLFSLGQPLALARLQDLAEAITPNLPDIQMDVHITVPPQELANSPETQDLFNSDWMRHLESIGYERALSTKPWDSFSSPYVRPQSAGPVENNP